MSNLSAIPVWAESLDAALLAHHADAQMRVGGCFGYALALSAALHRHGIDWAEIAYDQPKARACVRIGKATIDLGLWSIHDEEPLGATMTEEQVRKMAIDSGLSADDLDRDTKLAKAVLSTAMALAAKKSPSRRLALNTTRDVVSYALETATDDISIEMVEEMFSGTKFVLTLVPASEVCINPAAQDAHQRSQRKEASYACMDPATMPPLLLGELGEVEDGHHRLRVSLAAGREMIPSYLMVDESFDLSDLAAAHQAAVSTPSPESARSTRRNRGM